MNLVFENPLFSGAILAANAAGRDGEGYGLEGSMPLGVYALPALAFFTPR